MKGLLIYDVEGAKRNAWFIDQLIEKGKSEGLFIDLLVVESDEDFIDFDGYDVAINRTRFPFIAERAEGNDAIPVNSYVTALVANDKMSTYQFAQTIGVEALKTQLFYGETPSFSFPCVMKSTSGHGGTEVYFIKNIDEANSIQEKDADKIYILQELCDMVGEDCRVYLLGDEVLCSVLRTSKEDFRSNFSLGGKARLFDLPEKYIEQAKLIARKLNADFIGVDFLRRKDGFVLNEIEDAVGSRMLYSLTDLDVAKLFVKHIVEKYKK